MQLREFKNYINFSFSREYSKLYQQISKCASLVTRKFVSFEGNLCVCVWGGGGNLFLGGWLLMRIVDEPSYPPEYTFNIEANLEQGALKRSQILLYNIQTEWKGTTRPTLLNLLRRVNLSKGTKCPPPIFGTVTAQLSSTLPSPQVSNEVQPNYIALRLTYRNEEGFEDPGLVCSHLHLFQPASGQLPDYLYHRPSGVETYPRQKNNY